MHTRQLLALVLLIVIFLSAGAWLSYLTALKIPVVGDTPVTIEIDKGDSFQRIINKLTEQQLAINPLWFKVIAFQQKTYQKLKAGEYELPPGITMPELLILIALGKTKQHTITFPEGWRFKQLLEALQNNPHIEHTLAVNTHLPRSENPYPELEKLLSNPEIRIKHPEGAFFPDTYFFAKHTRDVAVLKMAYDKMQQVLAQEWQHRAADLPLQSPYEALILASIVEKETGAKTERPQIAGVFIRRLQTGMLLQTDPTVIYGMGENYHGNITHTDLSTATPYNTYQNQGLPPTPIAMPGREAIHAALHPDDGNSLYFVARDDGTHVFSATLQAHNKAVNLYQKIRP
jgi:UPF0755 protein